VGVDFMWVLNPSFQVRAPVPSAAHTSCMGQCTSKSSPALALEEEAGCTHMAGGGGDRRQVTRPLAADWKAAVFAMVMTHVWDDHGVTSNEVCVHSCPLLESVE
jgi:hypothetical protein